MKTKIEKLEKDVKTLFAIDNSTSNEFNILLSKIEKLEQDAKVNNKVIDMLIKSVYILENKNEIITKNNN